MKPKTADERLLVLARAIRDLKRIKEDVSRADFGFLSYLLAMTEDEARVQMETLEGEAFPD